MNPMRLLLLPALLAFLAAPTFGEEELVLDLDTAVNLALRSNLGIEIETLGLEVKRNAKDTAYNIYYPQVTAGASFSRPNVAPSATTLVPDMTSIGPGPTFDRVRPYSPDLPRNYLSAKLQAQLNLSLVQIQSIRLTVQDWEAGLLNLESAKKRLALDVKKSFFNILVLEENIRLTEQNIQAAVTRYETARGNYRNGLVDEYAMLSAQVAVESLKPVLEEIRNGYKTALLSFKMTIGLDFDKSIKLKGSIEPEISRFDAKELAGRFMDGRLDVRSLVLAGKIAETQEKQSRASLYPTLSLIFSMDPTLQGDPLKDSWTKDWEQQSGAFVLGLNLSLDNFIPGSAAENRIRNAAIAREQNRVRLAQALQAAELEIRRIVMALEKSRNSMEVLKLNIELADKANRMGQEAYKAGLKEYSQIETTEVNLQEAKFNLLKEKLNYLTGLLDLENALNATIDTIKGRKQ